MDVTTVQNSTKWSSVSKQTESKTESTTTLINSLSNSKEDKKESKDQITLTDSNKLSANQIQSLKQQQSESIMTLMQSVAKDAVKQSNAWLASSGFDTSKFALPDMPTTPEAAAAAIAPGGAYSVDAVATRIFDLASTIAGDDADKLAEMRTAVEKGFAAAAKSFSNMTKQDLPDISKQTYDEIMKRFDARTKELTGTAVEEDE